MIYYILYNIFTCQIRLIYILSLYVLIFAVQCNFVEIL